MDKKYFKPTSAGNLVDVYNEICSYPVWTRILRSVRARRFRDPENPSRGLPYHKTNSINSVQRAKYRQIIGTIRAWLIEFEKKHNL